MNTPSNTTNNITQEKRKHSFARSAEHKIKTPSAAMSKEILVEEM